jgi:hypothetical protein
MVWLFPESPRYAGVAEAPPPPPKPGCSFWMFGLQQPSYSASPPVPDPDPTPQPTTTKLAIDIVCPAFSEDTNGRGGAKALEPGQVTGLQKGMPATVALPPGVTRYRFWFGPATWITPDSLRLVPCWPVATEEPASGVATAGALFITPTWVRHPGTGAIVAGTVKATVFVEFE